MTEKIAKKKILTIVDNAIYYLITFKNGKEKVVKEIIKK